MSRRLPDETVATIKALRAKGHSIREVRDLAKVAGIGTIHAYVKDVAQPFGRRKSGPKKKIAFNVCKALQDQGLSIRAIARQLGCGSTAVHRTLKTGRSAA